MRKWLLLSVGGLLALAGCGGTVASLFMAIVITPFGDSASRRGEILTGSIVGFLFSLAAIGIGCFLVWRACRKPRPPAASSSSAESQPESDITILNH